MFSVLTGAIIWVRFEKHTPMTEGEDEGPATVRFGENGRDQGEVGSPYPKAIHGLHGLHGKGRDDVGPPRSEPIHGLHGPASGVRRSVPGGTASVGMTALFIAGWNV